MLPLEMEKISMNLVHSVSILCVEFISSMAKDDISSHDCTYESMENSHQ